MVKTWPHSNESRQDRAWAFCASFFLHALPIVMLCSMSRLDLSIGPEPRLDFIWLTPSSTAPAADLAAPDVPSPTASQTQPIQLKEPQPAAADPEPSPEPAGAEAGMQEPAPTLDIPKASAKELQVVPAMVLPHSLKESAAPATVQATAVSHRAQQLKQPQTKKASLYIGQQTKTAAVAATDHEAPILVAENGAGDTPVHPQQTSQMYGTEKRGKALEPVAQSEADTRQPADVSHEQTAANEAASAKANLQPKAAAALPQAHAVGPPPAAAQASAPQPFQETRQAPKPSAAPPAHKAAASGHPLPIVVPKPISQAKETPAAKESKPKAEKPSENRGLVVTSIHGDLKMVMAGGGGLKLQVTFREYPKSRRNKVQSRAEAKRELKVVPIFAKTRQETREAVIEKAQEGVYLFSAESANGEPAKAVFTLKIFETGAKAKVIAIGTRSVSNKATVTKVLMPEGVVWDDDSAFTGSLEDSESVTKFNAATGLNWKEYND
jgi:hypothetical protein